MSAKLLTEHHLRFLSLKGGCTGWSESTLVKMPNCWKSHAAAQLSTDIVYTKIYDKLDDCQFPICDCDVTNNLFIIEFIILNSYDLLEHLAMLLTSTLKFQVYYILSGLQKQTT